MDSSLHYFYTREDERNLMELRPQILAAGAHGRVSCPWIQSTERYKKLKCVQEEQLNIEADP